jgi:hypothetical protein
MVCLTHEIWEDPDDHGEPSPGCCLSGPRGGAFRQLLGPRARLVHTFEAGSYFEAMTTYNGFLGRGPYTTEHPSDVEPYPASWSSIALPISDDDGQ